MRINSERLIITEFTLDMAGDVHDNSLDEDNRRFVPDEVFETIEDASDALKYLIACYEGDDGPYVYPVILNSGENVGYVQLVQLEDSWEIGFHIAKKFTKCGYATEAVRAFLPVIMKNKNLQAVYGICLSENSASRSVLEYCKFQKIFEGTGIYQGAERLICKYVYKTDSGFVDNQST